jgi:hypothetical protein
MPMLLMPVYDFSMKKGLDLSRFPCYQTVNLGKVSSLFMAHVRIFSAAVIRCRRCLSLSILPV